MKLIAHRGNVNGPNKERENHPDYILQALNMGYDVEVDCWVIDSNYFLGHDEPLYLVSEEFLSTAGLWIHCKNIDAMSCLKNSSIINPYFFHNIDDVTLTSNGYFWTYPGKQLTPWSIAVMPEMAAFDNIEIAYAVCSDFVEFNTIYMSQ